jgi:hypothetical protein
MTHETTITYTVHCADCDKDITTTNNFACASVIAHGHTYPPPLPPVKQKPGRKPYTLSDKGKEGRKKSGITRATA